MADDELELHFQPIYNTTTLTVVSVEALLRWQHPTLGTVPPTEFMPLAEKASQLEFLTEIGCDAVQGFMMSRAELPDDITKLLRLDREKVSGLCLDLPQLGLEKIYF